MALTTFRGYVVSLRDHATFDRIVKFLDERGAVVAAFAPGVRKITSKNGRHLAVGNLNETEMYGSRFPGAALGRLKRTVALVPAPWEFNEYAAFALLNEYAERQTRPSRALYGFYGDLCAQIAAKRPREAPLLMATCAFVARDGGLPAASARCADCGAESPDAVDRADGAWRCGDCGRRAGGDPYPMRPELVGALRAVLRGRRVPEPVPAAGFTALVRFFRWLFSEHLGMSFKSLEA